MSVNEKLGQNELAAELVEEQKNISGLYRDNLIIGEQPSEFVGL